MKKTMLAVIGSALMTGVALLPPAAFARGQKAQAAQTRRVRERHPRIRAAVGALEAARAELQQADNDFGGHKRDAIEAVDNALRQLRLAIQFDR